MKKLYSLTLILFLSVSFNCKSQNINPENYTENIVGTWIEEEDTNNKLIFTKEGLTKVYIDNILENTYEFSIEKNSCQNYFAENVYYLKWKDLKTLKNSCLEISAMSTNTLSLMIIDTSKILFYHKK